MQHSVKHLFPLAINELGCNHNVGESRFLWGREAYLPVLASNSSRIMITLTPPAARQKVCNLGQYWSYWISQSVLTWLAKLLQSLGPYRVSSETHLASAWKCLAKTKSRLVQDNILAHSWVSMAVYNQTTHGDCWCHKNTMCLILSNLAA